MNKKNNIETDIVDSANSGAKISIISKNNATYIKKSEKHQLERYKISISKQESFIPIGSFKSALILDKKISKKNIDILMPFYNGISGSNFSISISRSQINRSATDCTRPAEREPGNLRHKTGDRLKPTR